MNVKLTMALKMSRKKCWLFVGNGGEFQKLLYLGKKCFRNQIWVAIPQVNKCIDFKLHSHNRVLKDERHGAGGVLWIMQLNCFFKQISLCMQIITLL